MARRPNNFLAREVEYLLDVRKGASASITAAVTATQAAAITFATAANTVDTDYYTVDGVLYELDKSGDGVTAGRVQVDMSAATTAADVAAIAVPIMAARQPYLTFVDNADGTVDITNKIPGANGNITLSDNVAHASFVVASLTNGADAVLVPNDDHSATEQIKLFTVPAGQKFRLDEVEYINPTGIAQHASNYWEIEIYDDAVSMAIYSTATAADGTITANTPVNLTVNTDGTEVAAASSVISVKFTKVASAADLPPGKLRIRGRYL